VTSSISYRYLPGILIGYVDSIEEDSNHLTRNGYILPAVDFKRINHVFVILAQKENGDGSVTDDDLAAAKNSAAPVPAAQTPSSQTPSPQTTAAAPEGGAAAQNAAPGGDGQLPESGTETAGTGADTDTDPGE
jgi:rod shape-determining protein MreC